MLALALLGGALVFLAFPGGSRADDKKKGPKVSAKVQEYSLINTSTLTVTGRLSKTFLRTRRRALKLRPRYKRHFN